MAGSRLPLNFNRTTDSIGCARELRQDPVADNPEYTSVVPCNPRLNNFRQQATDPNVRSGLVSFHESRVSSDIRDEYRR